MKQKLKVALLQMTSVDDVKKNVDQILKLLSSLDGQKVQIAFLPENCLYMRIQDGSVIPSLDLSLPIFQKLQSWVDEQNCRLHLGSVPVMWNRKLTNATVLIEPSEKPQVIYKKIHLFDIELQGQKPIRESDVFSHGDEPSILNFQNWKIGQTICYDLRFSELFNYYAYKCADIIAVPSSFLVKTGEAHWEVLLRARAIESQCFIIASAQSGQHISSNGQRSTYGHSLIVSPWGEKLVEIPSGVGIQVLDLDPDMIELVRKQIPMKNHRRFTKIIPKE